MGHTAKRRRLTRRTVDVALLLAMVTLMSHQVAGGALHEWLALMASFAVTIATVASMSEHAVPFLSGAIPVMEARALHLACSYWSMALVGLHVGIHWHPVVRALAT